MKKYYKNIFGLFIKTAIIFVCVVASTFIYTPANTSRHYNHTAFGQESNKITYAKAKINCMLYKTSSMSNEISNMYFYIPETYFVAILSNFNNDIYKVQYLDFTGFCYADNVDVVSFVPNKAYLTGVTFSINSSAGTQIWSAPSDTKGIKFTTIPANTVGVEYIASTTGDIPLGGNTDIWYYARFTPATNTTSVYEGYVYGEATVNLSNIPNNLEVDNIPEIPDKYTNITINGSLKIILIALICLPFLILFVVSLLKAIRQFKIRKQTKADIQTTTQPITNTNNVSFVKKTRPKPKTIFNNTDESNETIEVVFPEYDYIDDDDLL